MTDDDAVYADWSALRTAVPAVLGTIAVAVVGLVGWLVLRGDDDLESELVDRAGADRTSGTIATAPSTPDQVVALFVDGLEAGRFTGMTYAFTEPADVAADYAAITGELGPFTIDAEAAPSRELDAANATAPVTLAWELDDGTRFTTEGAIDLVLIGTRWQVDWEPSILESSLDPGDVLVRERVVAPRAPILGRDGVALIDNRPVVDIGVIPRQVDDIVSLSEALGQLIGEDPADIRATIAPQPSDSTVSIATRSQTELADVEARLATLPGVVLTPSTQPLPPDPRFGRALLGRSAEVTAEILEESPGLFEVGEIVGRSGLQRQYNERLHGVPGFQVKVRRRFPTSQPVTTSPSSATTVPGDQPAEPDPAGDGAPGQADPADPADPGAPGAGVPGAAAADDPDVVFLSPPQPGTPLQLTIDQRVQTAAEDALAATELVSALVAVEVSTGHVLAVANGPGAAVQNFAMTGQYPPGSIFKTVTAYAAMSKGVRPDDPVDCPFSLNVNGRDFTNAEGEVLGVVPLRRAYVLSCNTAFINLASVLDPSDFPATAARFGIGVGYSLGTPSFAGSVPAPGGPVEFAATSFGQSQVLVSPLSAAVMAATAAGGTYRPPVLVLEPGAAPPEPQALDPGPAAELQQMMRAVVTNGTGRAVAGVGGGPVSGKTGTAEFGNANPPQAHAWFIGYQGDLAFAVFVEGGEFGGATAAPIAGDFLNRLSG